MKFSVKQVVFLLGICIFYFIFAPVSFGQTAGICAEQITPYSYVFPSHYDTPAINDLGEIVWTQPDQVTGNIQLRSNFRGDILTDPYTLYTPTRVSINNRGDVLWKNMDGISGIISGKQSFVFVHAGLSMPAINDQQEIVALRYWSFDTYTGIYSTYRGQLTYNANSEYPTINNKGDIIWKQYDLNSNSSQIFGIISGVRTQLTNDSMLRLSPSINDALELVWVQDDATGPGKIYSSVRGRLNTECVPNVWFGNASVNSCGDVVATGYDPSFGSAVYRIGNASPCGNTPEPNNDQATAVQLVSDRTATGVLDTATNATDWFRFDARTGDPIKISVNWGFADTQQNQLNISLLDANGASIGSAGGLTSPSNLDLVASYSGIYYIRLETLSGKYGYGLYLKVGLGRGACPDCAITAETLNMPISDYAPYSLNALGEIIWSKPDETSGFNQIFSSTRGQLTFDMVPHEQGSGNNKGDLVWIQYGQVYGILSGTPVQLTNGPDYYGYPAVNDLQEVVAIQYGYTGASIYSTQRGILTPSPVDIRYLSLNNKGDVIWLQYDDATGASPIYGIISGVLTQLTTDTIGRLHPSINDTGEIVWSQQRSDSNAGMRIVSNVRGQITYDCPYSVNGLAEHISPVINSCGDIAFLGFMDGQLSAYRLGSASPCIPDAMIFDAQIDVPRNTTAVSNSIIVSGLTTTTPITIAGGEYEINNSGIWTSANGKISNRDSVRVRLLSSDLESTTTRANLMIGGGLGTFWVTTSANTLPPTVVITSPLSSSSNNSTPLLVYIASAGNIVVSVDNIAVSKSSGDVLDALADGMHNLKVEVTDAAGRVGSATVEFTVDTVSPKIKINHVESPTNATTLTITGRRGRDASVTVSVDTGAIVGPIQYRTAKTWRCTISGLSQGLNTITAKAEDVAGNSSSTTRRIRVR